MDETCSASIRPWIECLECGRTCAWHSHVNTASARNRETLAEFGTIMINRRNFLHAAALSAGGTWLAQPRSSWAQATHRETKTRAAFTVPDSIHRADRPAHQDSLY